MKTTFFLLFLSLLQCAPAGEAPRDAGPKSLSLGEVTRAVLASNPALEEVRHRWEAARQRVTQEGAWADLKVSAGSAIARFVNVSPNGFTDQSLALEQSIPISGKNRVRARMAAAEAVVAFEEVRRADLEVTAQARTAYFRLANAYAQIELNRKNYTSLTQIAEINRSRYQVGAQTAADVLASETEAGKLLETRRDLERNVELAESQLNVLMNRDAFASLGQPNDIRYSFDGLTIEQLRTLTLANRPEVRAARARVSVGEAGLQLAHRAWIPDPALTASSQRYNDTGQAVSEVGAGISFSIPWGNFRKYSAGVSEARATLGSSRAGLERVEKEANGALRDALQKAETANHHVELFQNKLLPQARQTFEASQFAYESGKAGFNDWITAQRTARGLEAEAREHVAEYQIALAELEAVVGADLHIFSNPPERKNQ
ncbi:MAG TPA: TolC family protein [Chthoniobacterales bacterium]